MMSPKSKEETTELSLEYLYNKYYRMLTLFAHQIIGDVCVAQDIVQDFFIRFWKSDKKKEDDFNYEVYFFQAIKHASLNHIRNEQRHEKAHRELGNQLPVTENLPSLPEVDDYEIIYITINKLPAKRKEIFEMVYIDGMKYQEAADKLGVSFHTVKSQINRSLLFLRKNLSNTQFTLLFFYRIS